MESPYHYADSMRFYATRCSCMITTAHKKMYERVVLVLCMQCHRVDMTLDAPKISC